MVRTCWSVLMAIFFLGCVCPWSEAQVFRRATGRMQPGEAPATVQRLTVSDPDTNDFFGWTVAIHENTLAGCVLQADGADNQYAGEVTVFTRTEGVWSESQMIPNPEPATDHYFGQVLAMSDDQLFVGSPNADVSGMYDVGRVYVYTRQGDAFAETQRLVLDEPIESAHFGISLATDGETLVIGATRADENQKGLVFILERDDTSWYHTQTLGPADRMSDDNFGASSALDGDWLAVGATGGFQGPIWGAGEVYVFRRQGDSWIEHQKLTPTDPDWYDTFGGPIAISGHTMLISALGKDHGSNENAGAVYVFTETSGNWTQGVQLFGPNPADGTAWGQALAFFGDTAMIGFPNILQTDLPHEGAVDVLFRSGGVWSYGPRLFSPQPVSTGAFGFSLALSGSNLLIGAPLEDASGPVWDAGAAYVMTMPDLKGAHTAQEDGPRSPW